MHLTRGHARAVRNMRLHLHRTVSTSTATVHNMSTVSYKRRPGLGPGNLVRGLNAGGVPES